MAKVPCSHCRLEFDESIMIQEKNNDLYFCCNGCQGVYHLLKSENLDSFYEKLGNRVIAPPLTSTNPTQSFELESFRQRYVKTTKEGFSSIDLIIEGIHCAACVWLNEKVLADSDGVLEASINFTNNKAKVIWDDEVISLAQIIDKIRSIGYNAYPYQRGSEDVKATKNRQDYFLRMSVAIFASMNIMMIDVAKYAGFFSGIKSETLELIHIAEFIFATPVLFYSGWIFFRGAYYGVKNRIVTMDLLVSFGATLTYIYSLAILFKLINGHSYFDSVAMIITFVLVGKFLEVLGKKNAVDTMDKMKSQIPLEATIIEDGAKKVVGLDEIKEGDILEVKYGEKASVDGEIITLGGLFDESSITGESHVVSKNLNDKIYSGTINMGDVIRYRATKDYANSTLSTIVTLLEDSLASKPKIEEKANNISKYFSLTILLLAIATFIGWYLYGATFEDSLINAISVIVIACPCALALATPIASLIGISWASKRGLLFKEAKFIESFAKTSVVVLDKTGTITEGKLSVKSVSNAIDSEMLGKLYALTSSSTHPISVAIKRYLEATYHDIPNIELENIAQVEAKGLKANWKNQILLGGNSSLLKDFGINVSFESHYSLYHFASEGKVIVSFELDDTIKNDALAMIAYFKKIGVRVIMASGDNTNVVSRVASSVGIEEFKSQLSPIDKANLIDTLKAEGEMVVMVGDGINDVLALSKADVAIVMGSGADVALAIGDVVILDNSLAGLQKSFYISKRTYKFIKQNLALSLLYNLITIPFAIMGFVIPLIAALSMSLSSLMVVGNSMRIGKNDE